MLQITGQADMRMAYTVKLRYNIYQENRYIIGEVRYNQQGRKNTDLVHRIAVQRFRLLLILPLALIVIYLTKNQTVYYRRQCIKRP